MRFEIKQGSLTDEPCDILIINLFQGVKQPGGGTGAVDKALGGLVSETIRDEEFEGKLGDTTVVRPCSGVAAKKVVLVGLGKQDEFGTEQVMKASARAIRKCQSLNAKSVVSILHGAGIAGLSAYEAARAVTLGSMLGAYQHTRLKTENAKGNPVETFTIVELSEDKIADAEQGMHRGEAIGDAVCYARDLVNEPSNVVTPGYLAEQAHAIADSEGMRCTVLDRMQIREAGMGLLTAVARGSATEPRFIEMFYKAEGATKTVAIVGKGITFDSGGYSLKPAKSMYGMKDDMAGAASVLAAMKVINVLKPKVNVVALIPATENMIGGNAIHPGDVYIALNGKTVEVNNTDAEGRLILADAVAYANNLGVDQIIDLATLTGACVVALGRELSGVLGNDDEMVNALMAAGESTGEKLWRLPLVDEYKSELRSDIADLKNTGSRDGGAITGALFIQKFVGNTPWAHIDLSSSTVMKEVALARKGATGVGTGILIEYLMSL